MLYDDPLEELAAAVDADELCRLLVESAGGWGGSKRHQEAVELLEAVHGTGELGNGFLALLLCTCSRWDRVTARLIAALEESDLLTGAELDELAESFLVDELTVECSPEWLWPDPAGPEPGDEIGEVLVAGGEIVIPDGDSQIVITVDDDLPFVSRRRPEPPLRRWAAARVLRTDPTGLDELVGLANRLAPAHRAALLQGLLDGASGLAEPDRRRLVRLGLGATTTSARGRALDVLCDLDGPDAALRRAREDGNEQVRKWHPAAAQPLFT